MRMHAYRPGSDMDETLMCPSSHLLPIQGSPTTGRFFMDQTFDLSGDALISEFGINNRDDAQVQNSDKAHRSPDGSVVETMMRMLGQRPNDQRSVDTMCVQGE